MIKKKVLVNDTVIENLDHKKVAALKNTDNNAEAAGRGGFETHCAQG